MRDSPLKTTLLALLTTAAFFVSAGVVLERLEPLPGAILMILILGIMIRIISPIHFIY